MGQEKIIFTYLADQLLGRDGKIIINVGSQRDKDVRWVELVQDRTLRRSLLSAVLKLRADY
jgi:hypothetical protein